MEAGVFYGDTHSIKLSGETDTFADKEQPLLTAQVEKQNKTE